MKPILEIQNISKKFRIRHEKQPYLSLRDSISSVFSRKETSSEDFFALRDISFNVLPGESIGIIGKNGAGKSTLLKILSKITPPTSGKIIARGRIASLLEVGTGFHPELSGRENIYLNGSILGMKRAEIGNKFDQIIDFSGIEKFLDTPLKHYSSGMQLRLAFSVAAFLDPEIMVIDEVLAVGDAEFQKKCMGKMEDVSRSGRTVLFVSHNLGAVAQLCPKTIYLQNGGISLFDDTEKVISKYLNSGMDCKSLLNFTRNSSEFIELLSIELLNPVENNFAIKFDEPLKIRIRARAKQKLPDLSIGLGFTTADYIPLFTVRSKAVKEVPGSVVFETEAKIHHNLRAGLYNVSIGFASGRFNYYHQENIAQLEILNYGNKHYNEMDTGLINCDSEWEINTSK